jgi:hypothetical protein
MNLQEIKTLAEFKRKLTLNTEVHTIFHQNPIGRDTEGKSIYNSIDKGIRKVSILQTNCFALATEKEGKIIDSFCYFPKATNVTINDNKINIFEQLKNGDKILLLTYSIIQN